MLDRYFVEVTDCFDVSYVAKLLPYISTEKKDRVPHLIHPIDRILAVYSEALLRTIICESLSIANRDIVFCKNKYGKPYLVSNSDFYFNISHTRSAFVIAVGDSPVGIDMEKCRDADQAIASEVFTLEEYAYIYAQGADPNMRFCEIWTRKEAYLKWSGEGWSPVDKKIRRENDEFSVQVVSTQIGQYMISTCTRNVNINTGIIQLPENNLFERLEIICRY